MAAARGAFGGMERSGLSAFEILVVGLAGAAAVVGGVVWGLSLIHI